MSVPTARRAVIKGTGSALPRNKVSNDELTKTVDTTDEWIIERTGIKFRHIAEPDETTSSLATLAARQALESADMTRSGYRSDHCGNGDARSDVFLQQRQLFRMNWAATAALPLISRPCVPVFFMACPLQKA